MTNTTAAARKQYASGRAEHVGSFLRSPEVKQARLDIAAGKIDQAALKAVEDKAIIDLVEKQKNVGLTDITDGETRRAWWHFDFMEHLLGAEGYERGEGIKFKGVTTKPHAVRIVDRIAYNPNHPQFAHFTFLHDLLKGDTVHTAKMTIPSPNMFMIEYIRDNPVYGPAKLDQYVEDIGIAYQKTIKKFYELGCRYIQLDDVFWARLVDKDFVEKETARGVDIDRLGQACVDTLNIALENKPTDLVTGMHICRGNFSSTWHYQGSYDSIEQLIFKGLKQIDRYFLEYDDERSGGFAPLEYLADSNSDVVLGLITSKRAELENRDEVIARIHEAAKHFPIERFALSPQCGFSSTEEGNKVAYQAQWDKLALIKSIADEVWGK